jgi:hypothetical protein
MSDATIHQLAAYRRPGDPSAEVAELELLAQRADAVLAAAETAISGSRRGRPGLQALSAEVAVLSAALAAVASGRSRSVPSAPSGSPKASRPAPFSAWPVTRTEARREGRRPGAAWDGCAARIRTRAAVKAERTVRAALGMPARHPERLTGELPERQEEQLAALAAELWPDDKYAQIIADTRREREQGS